MVFPTDERINSYAVQLCNRATGLLLILNRERKVVLLGPGTDVSLGYSPQEIEGNSIDDVVCPEFLDDLIRAIDEADKDETTSIKIDLGLKLKDGQFKIFQVLVFTLKGPDGRREFGLRGQDITHYVEVQKSIELMNKKLSILGSTTRHDVLNSLTGLFGYLELAESKCKDDLIIKYIRKSKLSADTIRKQMEFTRDYQEIGSKKPSWIRVEDSIRSAYNSISEPRIQIDIDVGELRIYTDPMLEKVFYNLLDNAHRHSGAKKIRTYFKIEDEKGLLVFEDDGRGIPTDEKDIIFARGYGKNSGLGLHLIREVFSITGITINEDGEPGKGARFVITIPKCKFEY